MGLFALAAASCSGEGGCGVASAPLPGNSLPADQTIEGGAQIRLTSSGLGKVELLARSLIDDSLGSGFCLGPTDITVATLCTTNAGSCRPGCEFNLAIDSLDMSTPTVDKLHLAVQFDILRSLVHVDGGILGSCSLGVTVPNARVNLDLPFKLNQTTGELLRPEIGDINAVDVTIPNPSLDGCGFLGSIFDAIDGALIGLFEDQIRDAIFAQINGMMESLLPDPMGIEGMVDVGALLGSVAPGTKGRLEMRVLPGGFSELRNGGITMGGIFGINSDRNTATRTRDLDNEPARCVPPMIAPDPAAPPMSLTRTPRGTFLLAPLAEFRGEPEPDADLAIGISETALDLMGHHLITSGAMCLDVGAELLPTFNLGTISLLVPSLGLLGQGNEPLMLSTRPLLPIDFDIGEGTPESPSVTLHLHDFEIDMYAFLFERFVRVFSLRLSADVGIDFEITTTASGAPALLPVLSGLESRSIDVVALNAEFLRESAAEIQAVIPAVLDLALPMLAGGLGPIELPALGGLALADIETIKLTTSEDEFLAVLANLELAPALGARDTSKPLPERVSTRASLARVTVPDPARIRAGLAGAPGGQLPEIAIDIAPVDAQGRQLEWTWNLDGGMWRPFTSQTPLIVRDPALAVQGRHRIEVRARAAGDPRTIDLETAVVPVLIDSLGPTILEHEVRTDGDRLMIPARDLVSPADALVFAYGKPGASIPATEWQAGGLRLAELDRLAEGGKLAVHVRDEAGNVSMLVVDITGKVRPQGSGCSASNGTGGLGLLAGLAALLLIWRAQRPRRAAVAHGRSVLTVCAAALAGASLGMSAGCSGKSPAEDSPSGMCESHEQCDVTCAAGTVGFCLEGTCECSDDLPTGRVGQDLAMAVLPTGELWISAYNSAYGDLNVAQWKEEGKVEDSAWAFVDGVPEGPVLVENSKVRGGIRERGDDVGRYTSIAVAPGGEVVVSYYDPTHASLKFASNHGGVWQTHTVDEGVVPDGSSPAFELAGQYSSITTRSDNGRPGIAYFVQVADAEGATHTEVRFASAQTEAPKGPEDWIFYDVDKAELPPDDQASPDPIPLPNGVGLFITSARTSDHTPVLAYYDRLNGNLKLARFDLVAGVFAQPEVLDGANGVDVGWYPSIAIDGEDQVHVSYVNRSESDLFYINTIDRTPVLVDDGYREVGTTETGLPKPELHRVGDDSSIVITPAGPIIVYQDATTRELLMAGKGALGFERVPLAGGRGSAGYGFYTSAAYDGTSIVISNWVVDPPSDRAWVEIHRRALANR